MKNTGKLFEQDLKKSVPDYALMYRLPDPAQVFSKTDNLRFSAKSPFDFLLWDAKRHLLYAFEAKTVAGKAISFERSKEESKEIHYHQIQGLTKWSEYDGITAGFIIEFRGLEQTIFLDIQDFNKLIEMIDKKSFNVKDLADNGLPYFIIPQQRMKTRSKYDIDAFLARNKK